jgi:hypothetical protein
VVGRAFRDLDRSCQPRGRDKEAQAVAPAAPAKAAQAAQAAQ